MTKDCVKLKAWTTAAIATVLFLIPNITISAPLAENWQRTVVFIYSPTNVGQSIQVKGGLSDGFSNFSRSYQCRQVPWDCAIPIKHRNNTSSPDYANDHYLDWFGPESGQTTTVGSPLIWTTNVWPSNWGAIKTVAHDGYGVEPLNKWGQHYWMLDVDMDCSKTANGWFEIKANMLGGAQWEPYIGQFNTPYRNENHFAQCGKINKFSFGKPDVEFIELNNAPQIISSPVTTAQQGNSYKYQVVAQDKDSNSALTYSLIKAPVGMTIDSTTGVISWIPTSDYLSPDHQLLDKCEKSADDGQVTVHYENFSDLSLITLNGKSKQLNPTVDNKALRLTDGLWQSSSAFITEPITLRDSSGFKASFSTSFSFQITKPQGKYDKDGQGADGMVFVVQTVDNKVGTVGGGIGYEGINPSLGIEFDTWDNQAQDDYNGNHLAVNVNGAIKSVSKINIDQRFNDGQPWHAWVDYDGENKKLEVRVSQSTVRPALATLSYNVDLATLLKTDKAYIGFTSATGDAANQHDVLAWDFVNRYAPIGVLSDLVSYDVYVDNVKNVVTAFISNRGIATTPENHIAALYIGSPKSGGKKVGEIAISALAAGDNKHASWSFNSINDLVDDLYVVADDNKIVSECDENNNISKSPIVWVKVADNQGGENKQVFSILVTPGTKEIPLSVKEDEDVSYTISDASSPQSIDVFPKNGIADITNGVFNYKPSKDYFGNDVVTIKLGQSEHTSVTFKITVEAVNDAPLAENVTDILNEDTKLKINMVGSDVDDSDLSFSVVQNPQHGILKEEIGVLYYIPNKNFNGVDYFKYVANDGKLNSDVATYSLNVIPVNDPPVAHVKNSVVDEDQQLLLTFAGVDIESQPLNFTPVSLPSNGRVIKNDKGQWIYIPSHDFNGADSFLYKANDGELDSTPAIYNITVQPVNDSPVAESQSISIVEDSEIAVQPQIHDVDSTTLIHKLVSKPVHGVLAETTTGWIYRPEENYSGVDYFEYIGNDGSLDSNIAKINIQVTPVNDAPVADDKHVSVDEDSSADISLTGSDVEAESLRFDLVEGPAHGTIEKIAENTYKYRPNINFFGADSFRYLANDGELDSKPATVTVKIVSVNDAPTAENFTVSLEEDSTNELTFKGADIENDTLSYRILKQPEHGKLTNTGTKWLYSPDVDFNGVDSIDYVANDGELESKSSTVSLNITPVNDQPVSRDQSVVMDEDATSELQLLGEDKESSTLSYRITKEPLHGTLHTLGGGKYRYVPLADYFGKDEFNFVVNDGELDSDVSNVSIDVIPVNDIPVVPALTLTTRSDKSLSIFLTAEDKEQKSFEFKIINKPQHGQATLNGNQLIYTPDIDYTGNDTITYVANDGFDDSLSATISITVTEKNKPPVITSSPVTQGVKGGAYLYHVIATDPEGLPLDYKLIDAPEGMLINKKTGVISWNVPSDYASSIKPVVISVLDNEGLSASQNYNISVDDIVNACKPQDSISFKLDNFIDNDTLQKNQSATIVGDVLRLVPAQKNKAGSAFVKTAIPLEDSHGFQASFSTFFSFRITNSGGVNNLGDDDGPGADGLVFAIQTVSNNVGGTGGGIGFKGIPKSVGIEFDTYKNDHDNGNGNHIGIDVNGNVISQYQVPYPYLGGKRFNNGEIWYVWVDYNGVTQDLEVRVANENKRPAQTFIKYAINLVPILQTKDAYIGFTSGTGSAWGDHDILSWQFINTYNPIGECGLPYFSSLPIQLIEAGYTYKYVPTLNNKMPGHFELIGPSDMSVNSVTGELSWPVTNAHVGDHEVTLRYITDSGKVAEQVFPIKVINHSGYIPKITSTPILDVYAGNRYSYQMTADDLNQTGLSWRLLQAPEGMTFHDQRLEWQPSLADVGSHLISVEIMDGFSIRDTQTFTLSVLSDNHSPVIKSSPSELAKVGNNYSYTVNAFDIDNDALTYQLLIAPAGMHLDAQGELSWVPNSGQENQTFTVSIQVQDVNGAKVIQTWGITVSPQTNHAPIITSTPISSARVDKSYQYQISASDEDGDPLHYELVSAPEGMKLEGSTLVWVPSLSQLAQRYDVKVKVADNRGASISQYFTVTVVATEQPNQAPAILSSPQTQILAGEQYSYRLVATDPDGDHLTYQMLSGPSTASLSPDGLLLWNTSITDLGIHSIKLSISDGQYTLTQNFNIQVLPVSVSNTAPTITSIPGLDGKVGETYRYIVTAFDSDHDVITYRLLSAPIGMTIDNQGVIEWNPSAVQEGMGLVVLGASDGKQETLQRFSIHVVSAATTLPLTLNYVLDKPYINPSETVLLQIVANGGDGELSLVCKVDGLVQPISVDNKVYITLTTAGIHSFTITAVDAKGQTITKSGVISVKDSADAESPLVDISSPDDLSNISHPIEIKGAVQDSNLVSYKLLLSERGKANWQEIAVDYHNMEPGSVLGLLDPTMLTNGLYDVVLQATDVNGRISSDSIVVNVEGDLKVGNFSISYTDVTVPMAGIPLKVTRTYDSRRRREDLDFGFGWSIDYQNVKVEESRVPGKGWEINTYLRGPFDLIADYCIEPMGAPIVTVTLPDGKQEKFAVEASPRCKTYDVILDVDLSFKALSGTDAELEVIDGKQARYLNSQLVEKNLFSDPINPQKYKLTTKAGYQYYIDQSKGLEKVITPNLQTVTYTSDGIYHSDGSALLFKRDSKGRITSIIDPKHNEYTYAYSDKGDLVTAATPLKEKTTYTYNKSHGLLDIIDPLAHRLVRNIYDDNGRLIAQEDNDGNKKTFDHDIDGRQSVITDRNNQTTIFYYDEYGHVTTKVDAKDQTWQYKYDKDGNQLEQINPLGFSTTASYDNHRNLLTQTDGEGNTTSFTYNKRGQELTITDALNRTYSNTYDSVGNLLTVKGPTGKVSGNNINAKGLVSSTVDVLGYETKFTYDDKGNKLTETNPLGDVVRYTYDDNGNVLTELRTRTDGNEKVTEVTRYTYDARNRVIATEEPDGSITRNEYDMAGNLIAEIDALSRRTEHTYDAYGRLLETCYPDGSCERKRYDLEGNVLEETDRLNRTTSYEYDELNRLVKTIYADKTYSSTGYDAAGRISSETDARGNTKSYLYDKADRRTAIIDANDNKHTIVYNDVGLIESETDANNNTTTYGYNALGQRIKTIFNDKSGIEEEYNDKGTLISKTDANKRKTTFKYDKLGRLIKVIDAKDQETTYTYDEVGNKLSQTDAENRTTKWRYDSQGRVLSRVLPLAQSEFYTYDAAGNMLSHVDFNGAVKKYTYDTNNRITQVDYSNGSSESFTYNALNRLSAKNNAGETKYQYDDLNRLKKEIQPGGITLSYEYDAGGNRTKITTTKDQYSTQTSYKFDVLNRLEWVEDNDGGKTVYKYDPVGNRIKQSLPNGVVTNYVYDSLNRLTELSSYNDQKQLITHYVYTLDATGRRSAINEHHSGRVTNYIYDELYRLTEENIKDEVNGNYVASYIYDKVGNRTESVINGVVTQYRYDANDRLEKQGGVDYQYDSNGNTINETEDGITTNYTYDPADRLVSVERNGTLTEYGYNSDGIRVSKTIERDETRFIVDSNRQYAEVISEWLNGQPQVNYTHADELLSQQRGSKASYYLYDGHGSVRALIDKDGIVTDSYDYDAFGGATKHLGTTSNNYLFTGEQYDSSIGLYYLRARFYNESIARFHSMDSWSGDANTPLSINKYIYANSDPINNIDPSGHFSLVQTSVALTLGSLMIATSSPQFGLSQLMIGTSSLDDVYDYDGNNKRRWSVWDSIVASAFPSVPVMITSSVSNSTSKNKKDTEGHHTIPIYLCGAKNQGKLPELNYAEHRAIHAGISGLYLALSNAEAYANAYVPFGRRRNNLIMRLADTQEGRTIISNKLQDFYSQGWFDVGRPTIGVAFPKARIDYINGVTSLRSNCHRNTPDSD